MFCKNCGHNNHETANYCINDGLPLKEISDNVLFSKEEIKFCSTCGQINDNFAIYENV